MFSTVKAIWIFVLTSSSFVISRDIEFRYAFEGPCNTNSGKSGWCLELILCPTALQSIISGRKVKHCGFEDAKPIVCCPLDDGESPSGRISEVEEVLPPKIDFECGLRSQLLYELFFAPPDITTPTPTTTTTTTTTPVPTFDPWDYPNYGTEFFPSIISGGIEAFRNSWPWMVLLGRERGPNTDFFCSGSLINENYVITAAHCVLDFEPFFVRLGEHDYKPNEASEIYKGIEDHNVTDIVFHPRYNISQVYDDIALLKLANKITFKDIFSPICLPWGKIDKEGILGQQVTLAGWGKEDYSGFSSSVLREVNVTVFNPEICDNSYSTVRGYGKRFPNGITLENSICAGDLEGEKDACQGDSGGPMMHYDEKSGKYELAGIISTGYGCGNKDYPGIYAPLERSNTLEWIKNTAFKE